MPNAAPIRFEVITDLDTPIKRTFYYRKSPDKDWKLCGFGWENTPKYWLLAYQNIQFAKKTTKPRFKSKLGYPHGY